MNAIFFPNFSNGFELIIVGILKKGEREWNFDWYFFKFFRNGITVQLQVCDNYF